MSEPALELIGLAHAYRGTPVLEDVELSVAPGELVAVLGPSGCGKTTLLRAVAGLLLPRRGRLRVGGRDVAQDGRELIPAERRGVGLVFQEYALFPALTVRGNVAFALPRGEAARADELLDLVGLRELADRRPGELSGGQQQRVALARALAPRPHLLLLDEPFANVDAGMRQRLGRELRGLLRRAHTAALLVTHDPADAMAHADRLAVLLPAAPGQGARVAQVGPPAALYGRPASRAVATLLGPASFVAGEARGAQVSTALGELPLIGSREGAVEVALRPEQLRFREGAEGPLCVRDSAFLGRAWRLALEGPTGELLAEHGGERPPPLGARGTVEVRGACWALEG